MQKERTKLEQVHNGLAFFSFLPEKNCFALQVMRHTNGTMSSSSTSGGPMPQAMCQDEIVGGTKEVIKGKGKLLLYISFASLERGGRLEVLSLS